MAQKVQAEGRNSDTMLAHISPHEAVFLKRLGGSGTINPQTGLMEFGFFKKLKKAVKKVAKVVVSVAKAAAPMVVGTMFGPVAGALTGAALGATGGGGLKGALIGGLGGYLASPGQTLGSTIGESVAKIPGISSLGLSNQVLGAGVLGGASSASERRPPLPGCNAPSFDASHARRH
jgi:hypothetical protein